MSDVVLTQSLNKPAEPEKKPRISKRVTRILGYVIAITLCAVIGYLIISHIRPDLFPSPLGGGEPNEQKQADPTP